jgi:8-hydroxy-5-deazaflavin:NADPH oxidoreductase
MRRSQFARASEAVTPCVTGEGETVRIAVLGAGRIGGTIARRLSADGHAVTLANSRGPGTLRGLAEEIGATAAYAGEAAEGAQVVITSVPFPQVPSVREAISRAPDDAVVIDTSNYYSFKDGVIQAVEDGQVESVWVQEQLGRPIVKAWNSILAGSFLTKACPSGRPERIALAVSGDVAAAKRTAMELVDATGFDPVDAGSIADSWRQQPGSPAYCTDLTATELRPALAAAERSVLAERRDRMVAGMKALDATPTNDDLLRLGRKHYLGR